MLKKDITRCCANIWFYLYLQWAMSYLIDNQPFDEYLYILTVYTGLNINAGTKSNVRFIVIEGKHCKGKLESREVRQLSSTDHKVRTIYHNLE